MKNRRFPKKRMKKRNRSLLLDVDSHFRLRKTRKSNMKCLRHLPKRGNRRLKHTKKRATVKRKLQLPRKRSKK